MAEEYLVQGALLHCDKGEYDSRLEMKKSHGVYIGNKAVANKNDYVGITNISSFGSCSLGGLCIPDTYPWEECHEKTMITDAEALTTASIIQCKKGGHITVKESGQ